MKGKRGVPTISGKTAVFEKLIKHRSPLKDRLNMHPHSNRYQPAADSGPPLLSAAKK
jgi:hypothetical protein